jgi:hypothetical protein
LEFRDDEVSGRRWYLRINKRPKIEIINAIPPIAPPTIAPRILERGVAGLLLGAAGIDVDEAIDVPNVVA